MKRLLRTILLLALLVTPALARADGPAEGLSISIGGGGSGQMAVALKVMLLLTLLAFAPALLISMTSFTRIIIVLSFVRQALGTQQTPPNMVLIGLALFLTFFTMGPTFGQLHQEAIAPYMNEQIEESEAFGRGASVVRSFLLRHTRMSDLELFYSLSDSPRPQNAEAVPLRLAMPAFLLSELKTAFQMGFVLLVPFLLIDLVVASVLMAMGMMMLPPVLVALPFKILLFVLVDGWQLLVGSLARSF